MITSTLSTTLQVLLTALAITTQAYTVTNVDFLMYKNIDPILSPGKYKSHLHSFFGSDGITVNTTTSAELQAGCTTAVNPNDLSTYWIPTLLANTTSNPYTPIKPMRFSAYYIGIYAAEIPIQQDLRMIAGSSTATSQSSLDTLAGLEWFCEGEPTDTTKDVAAFPNSTCVTHLQSLLLFHDCVDPATLATTYSGTRNWNATFKPANRCPQNMKRIPQLRFSIRYDLRKVLPQGWQGTPPLRLSSGGSYSMHGDFFMGWLQEAALNMLAATSKTEFQGVDGPAGSHSGGDCGCVAEDQDPEDGTGDYLESVQMMMGM